MGAYPGYRTMSGVERRNARMHKLFDDAFARAKAEGRSSPWDAAQPPRWRRVWRKGHACRDCGRHRSTTVIKFWVTGMLYRVCADCIKGYRDRIVTKHEEFHA